MANNVFPVPLQTDGIPKDFSVEVALGNVSGVSGSAIVARNPSSTIGVFTDVWGGGTVAGEPDDMILPTSLEVWTIESTSPDDVNLTGIGAWEVLTHSLDADYEIQTPQITSLNGTTPVTISGTHYRPHHLTSTSAAIVTQADPAGVRSNVGTLIVRDSISGNVRIVIMPGVSKSEDANISVPAGNTLLSLAVLNPWGKGESGSLASFITPPGANAATVQGGVFPAYQNELTVIFQAKFKTEEKTDTVFRAKPDNDNTEVTVVLEYYVIDNDIVNI